MRDCIISSFPHLVRRAPPPRREAVAIVPPLRAPTAALAGEESTFLYGLPYNSPYNPPHNKRILADEEERHLGTAAAAAAVS